MLLAVGGEPARKNVAAWKAYNLRRWQFEKDHLPVDERMPFVCECTLSACFRVVELTALEYDAAHMHPNWTAVVPGHLMQDDGSRILVQHEHFWVVELDAL